MPPDGSMAERGRCDQIPLIPSSFKSRFHKATLRREMLMKLLIVEKKSDPTLAGYIGSSLTRSRTGMSAGPFWNVSKV